MALYHPAQHLLKLAPIEDINFIQSTTRVWVDNGETIVHYKTEPNGDNFIIYYQVKTDNEEQTAHEMKIFEKVPWDGEENPNHIVRIIIFEFDNKEDMIPLGSASNNSDDADTEL